LAYRAAVHGDYRALARFLVGWLDRKPTPPRVEATRDALLNLPWDEFEPGDGRAVLDHLQLDVRERYRTTRLLLNAKLKRHRMVGLDAPGNEELFIQPGIEHAVLDEIEPITHPVLVALLGPLSPKDREVVLLKASTGVAWATAAAECGRPRSYGETLRRRITRYRDRGAGL
ncbi:MAG: hypothetical protein Q8K72_08235, partial [Acidimicrobiales bacterium]|nr:hypothetical protein [Acidimicrobiales bacterium]